MKKNVEAIILAGGKMDDSDMAKSAIVLNGERILGRIVAALVGSKHVGRIILVGDVDRKDPIFRGVDAFAKPGDSMMTSLVAGIKEVKDPTKRVLGLCCDLPFLTPNGVDDGIECCQARPEAQLCYCIVERERYVQMFPDVPRTYARLRDKNWKRKHYCATGLVMIHPAIVNQIVKRVEALYRKKKNVLALAWELGLLEILLYLLGLCHVPIVEQTMSRILDIRGAAVEVHDPRLSVNADKMRDLELVAKYG